MFYEVEMRRRVVVEPHELGGALQTQRAMFRRLLQDVEGDVGSEEHGFYVAVTTVERVSEGHIRAGTGAVAFSVDFKCIVFSLSVDEVVEAQVTQVLPQGFFAGTKLHLTPSIACAMGSHVISFIRAHALITSIFKIIKNKILHFFVKSLK
jgi:DNA-directed RNA polymerase subunit E'/Rpb7